MQAGIHAAKRDITIASLYVGTAGGREEQFMHALASAVRKPAAERPRMVILLDALRSTRPSKDAQGADTQSLVHPSSDAIHMQHQLASCNGLGSSMQSYFWMQVKLA